MRFAGWPSEPPSRPPGPFLRACAYVWLICVVAVALTYLLHLIGGTLP